MSDKAKPNFPNPSIVNVPSQSAQLSHVPFHDDLEATCNYGVVIPAYGINPVASEKRAYVTAITGHRAGEMFMLLSEEMVIGRGGQSAIHLDSEGVSRRHACIIPQHGSFFLQDLNSTNGTWVADKRIQYHKLVEGDLIRIGTEMIIRFNLYSEEEARLQRELYERAVSDGLTKIFNRKHFEERLKTEIAYALKHRTSLCFIIFDVDFFKRVNDTYGHPAGDEVLKRIAGAISSVIRVEDVFARIGGEEFAILIRATPARDAVAFAERLRRGIESMAISTQAAVLYVTSSFGVASTSEFGDSFDGEMLLKLADRRLYEAKGSGRNRVIGPALF